MENILNKNVIRFIVAGAIDFSQSISIELYSEETPGAEEIPVNDIEKALAYDICRIVASHVSFQIHMCAIEHHWNVRPKKLWVKCSEHYVHSHESWNSTGRTEPFTFEKAIKEIKESPMAYELDLYGHHDYKSHLRELHNYFGGNVIFQGKLYEPEEFHSKK